MQTIGMADGADDFARRPARLGALAARWDERLAQLRSRARPAFDDNSSYLAETRDDDAVHMVTWDAFPRFLSGWFAVDADRDERRYRAAETLKPVRFNGEPLRVCTAAAGTNHVPEDALGEPVAALFRQQDEYCEWRVGGNLERVVFTCEPPEYWAYLAEVDIELAVELYRELVDERVVAEDLVWRTDVASYDGANGWRVYARAGDYNPWNRWNTVDGLVHCTHPANTLAAALKLIGDGTQAYQGDYGEPIRDAGELLCRTGFANPNRFSDPAIAGAISLLIEAGVAVGAAEPLGVTFTEPRLTGLARPSGDNPNVRWRAARRHGDAVVRAELTITEMTVGGAPLQFGGQVADHLRMRIAIGMRPVARGPLTRLSALKRCCPAPGHPDVAMVVDRACAGIGPTEWAAFAPVEGTSAARKPALTSPRRVPDPVDPHESSRMLG